jgi:MFS family permease
MDQVPPIEPRPTAPPVTGPRILAPLRERDFALLFFGTAVSLFGDGVYLVAVAWQAYELSDTPTALSLVGVAWTLPMVAFLLIGGVLGDRFDRRRLLIVSDVVRATAVAGIGGLALAGTLELWHLVALVAVYGAGEALFAPTFQAIVPDVVPAHMLVQANSLQQLTEPVAFRFVGPALGGALIAGLGTGTAFLIDAATFAVSATCVARMRPRGPVRERVEASIASEIREGFAFVRSQAWLWATLLSAAIVLLLYLGPFEVLVPYLVKNEYGGGAGSLGLVLGAAGIGAIGAALLMGERGLARRHVLWMYLGWAFSVVCLGGYAVVAEAWQAMVISLVSGVAFTLANITWTTLMHLHVPAELLGRVSGFDWLVSIGLVPVSFALAGPAAEAFGVEATMIVCGILACAATLVFLLVPGLRDPEQWMAAERPAPVEA